MCLIVFAWQIVPASPLIAVANRDEFHARPTAPAAWWDDQPNIFAGRDLQAGGSWMGITREGANGSRFAALTNIRAPHTLKADAPSRGALVADFLKGDLSPQEYVAALAPVADAYNGFNLLVGDRQTLIWYSNQNQDDVRNGQPLVPGVYGISNAALDTRWPKIVKTKAQFSSLLCQCAPDEAFFEMMSDTACAPDVRLPDTGVDLALERVLSAVCIESPGYGTRSSTLVRLRGDGAAVLSERVIC